MSTVYGTRAMIARGTLTVVVAQAVLIVASLVAMRMAERRGYWPFLLITFMALPIRGLVAASLITGWGVALHDGALVTPGPGAAPAAA